MTSNNQTRYLTGSEAGLSGREQIDIALKAIVQQGGIAETQQIMRVLNEALRKINPNYSLSDQGEATLRFFVNKVAVEAGYVYKHAPQIKGWRITPKGRDYIASEITTNPSPSRMLTTIGQDFQLALSDVYNLLSAERQSTTTNTDSATFIRAGVILTVTAWETFIEDTAKAQFLHRLNTASNPKDMLRIFNSVAIFWIGKRGNNTITPPELLKWSSDGWKDVLKDAFLAELSSFNTPKSDNIATLFKRYIDIDPRAFWSWHGMTSDQACQQLDELVSIRGGFVHRGRTTNSVSTTNREQLLAMVSLVEELAWTIEVGLNGKLP